MKQNKKEDSLDEKAKSKGYNYKVYLNNGSAPLYFKNAVDIGPFIRENYPNLKGWRGKPI